MCGEVFVAQEEVPSLPHTWRKPTCSEAKTCVVCGAIYGEPLGHNWLPESRGYRVCKTCGTKEAVEVSQPEGTSLIKLGDISFLLPDTWKPDYLEDYKIFTKQDDDNLAIVYNQLDPFTMFKEFLGEDDDYIILSKMLGVPVEDLHDQQTLYSDDYKILTARYRDKDGQVDSIVAWALSPLHTEMLNLYAPIIDDVIADEFREIASSIQIKETEEMRYAVMYDHVTTSSLDAKTVPYFIELANAGYKDSLDRYIQIKDPNWKVDLVVNSKEQDRYNNKDSINAGDRLYCHIDTYGPDMPENIHIAALLDVTDSTETYKRITIDEPFHNGDTGGWVYWNIGIADKGTARITILNADNNKVIGYKTVNIVDGTNYNAKSTPWSLELKCINLAEDNKTTNLESIPVGLPAYLHFQAKGPSSGSLGLEYIIYYPNDAKEIGTFDGVFKNGDSVWQLSGYELYSETPDPAVMEGILLPGTIREEIYDRATGIQVAEVFFEREDEYTIDPDWAVTSPINSSKNDTHTSLDNIPFGQQVICHFKINGNTDTIDVVTVKYLNGNLDSVVTSGKVVKSGDEYNITIDIVEQVGDVVKLQFFNGNNGCLIGETELTVTEPLSETNLLPDSWDIKLTVNSEKDDITDSKYISSGDAIVCHYEILSGTSGYSFRPTFKVYFTDGDVEEYNASSFVGIGKSGRYTIVDAYDKAWGTGDVLIEVYDQSTGALICDKTVTVW